jgi:single-strand DNA-binding protein
MLNRVTLIGNLGRDPEVKRFDNGKAVAKFAIATNEYYKDKTGELQSQTEWHDVVVWGALVDQAERALKKGMMVFVEGKITHRKYTDSNQVTKTITEIVAGTFRILNRPDGTKNHDVHFPSSEYPNTGKTQDNMPENPPTANGDDDMLPF